MAGTISGVMSYLGNQDIAQNYDELAEVYERVGRMQYQQNITNAQLAQGYGQMAKKQGEAQKEAFLGTQEAAIGASGLTQDSFDAVVKEATYNLNLDILNVVFSKELEAYNFYNAANEALITADINSQTAENNADAAKITGITDLITGPITDIGTIVAIL